MTTVLTSESSRRISSLDGLRAVSIALVLVGHLGLAGGYPFARAIPTRYLLYSGSLGVSIFFLLSGFIITTLLLRERAAKQSIDLKAFYVRRILRIAPAYYVYLAFLLGSIALAAIAATPGDLVAPAVFLKDYTTRSTPWTVHLWSLAVEEQFYLIWPLLLIRLRPRLLVAVCVAVVLLSPAIRIASYALVPGTRDLLTVMFHTRADTLVVGCLLALFRTHPRMLRAERAVRAAGGTWIALAFLTVISPVLSAHFRDGYLLAIGFSLGNACIAYLLLRALDANGSAVHRAIYHGLNLRPVAYIGTLSYSMYLWHVVFLDPWHGITFAFPLNLVAIVAVAAFSYHAVERPCIALRRRFGSMTAGTAATPVAAPATLRAPVPVASRLLAAEEA